MEVESGLNQSSKFMFAMSSRKIVVSKSSSALLINSGPNIPLPMESAIPGAIGWPALPIVGVLPLALFKSEPGDGAAIPEPDALGVSGPPGAAPGPPGGALPAPPFWGDAPFCAAFSGPSFFTAFIPGDGGGIMPMGF